MCERSANNTTNNYFVDLCLFLQDDSSIDAGYLMIGLMNSTETVDT